MTRRLIITTFLSVAAPLASAGNATLTDAGIKNVGSSAAYIASCEKESLVPLGTLAEFIAVLKEGLSQGHWEKVRAQYQASLHEQKQYSIAKDEWLPFHVSAANCRDIEKAIPVLVAAIKRNSVRKQPP
jgi:hypothetical protein